MPHQLYSEDAMTAKAVRVWCALCVFLTHGIRIVFGCNCDTDSAYILRDRNRKYIYVYICIVVWYGKLEPIYWCGSMIVHGTQSFNSNT